jgi:hypothetical protein
MSPIGDGYGIERPAPHARRPLREPARYLVLIEAAGASTALLFSAAREQLGEFDATEEIESLTRGVAPAVGASGAEWDRALAGNSAEQRAAALVYTLDV